MKKKILCVLFCAIFALSLCSCSQNSQQNDNHNGKNEIYIKPSDFSKETLKVLELFDEEIKFFDISLDESVKSFEISLWIFRNGEWIEEGKIIGTDGTSTHRIAVKTTEDICVLYSIDENRHSKCTYHGLDIPFEKSLGTITSKINSETPVEINYGNSDLG